MLQAVGDAGRDVGEVVGQPRRDQLGRVDVRVEHLGEVVDALEQLGEPLAHTSRSGSGPASGSNCSVGHEVDLHAEPGAGEAAAG